MSSGAFRRASVTSIGVAAILGEAIMVADLNAGPVWSRVGGLDGHVTGAGRHHHALQHQGEDQGRGSKLPAR